MKKIRRLTTALLVIIFLFSITATAMADGAPSLVDLPVTGLLNTEYTETTDTEDTETTTDAEEDMGAGSEAPGAAEKSTTEGVSAPDGDNPSPSPSPSVPEDGTAAEAPVGISLMSLIPGADVTATTWEDLKDSVEQAEVDGKIIALDPALAGTMSATAELVIGHNNSVVIDGGGLTLGAPSGGAHFRITNSGTGTVTLKNMTLDGTGGTGSVVLSGGGAKLDTVTVSSVSGTAVSATGTDSLTLTNVSVANAAAGVAASAGALTISDSSFQTISGTAVTASGTATLDTVTVDGAKNGAAGGSGLLTIDGSEFRTVATAAITLGSGGAEVTDTIIDGVTNGSGVVTGANTLKLTGSAITNVTGTGIAGNSGNITVDGCTFSETNGHGISEGKDVTVKNTLFENVRNQRGGHGSAIYAGTNLTVEASSFVNSASTLDSGYIQGAIVGYGGSGKTINVTRSYFKDNKASRYGGAIGLYQYGGTVNVSYSYFEGNGVSGKSANSDGGAIGVYNNSSSVLCTVNVDNNTFIGNTAGDDGSALFFEGRNDMVAANVTHNTFYGNKSTKYLLAAADSGGVVQLSLDVVGTFTNNTFIGNTAPNYASKHGAGAAVGEHIDSANAAVRPTATFKNNIFVGNGGNGGNSYASRNIDVTDGTDLGGNVGYDNGTAVAANITAESVFGTSPQPRANNTHHGAAGKAGSGYTGTLTTVVIQPNDGVTGQADNTAGAPAYGTDARGFTRGASNSDAGALEIKFVKFDANGGAWSGLPGLTYDGSKYYADDTASTGYFLVTDPGGSVSVLSGDLPTNGPLVFDGWYTQADGGTKATGDVAAADQTLYAHWKSAAAEYTVTYVGNGADAGTVPAPDTVTENTLYQVNATPPTRTGFTFGGWKADDASGTVYQPGGSFIMPSSDVTLTAVWAPVPVTYTITYHGNGSDGGTVPAPGTYNSGQTAAISGPGTMSRTDHSFLGWNTDPAGNGTGYTEGQGFLISGNLDLYAQWQDNGRPAVLYTLTFDSQGGTYVGPVTNIAAGSKVAAPAPPARTEYTFDGWHHTADCTCASDDPCWDFDRDTINGHKTLYARWIPAAQTLYTVTFDAQGGSGVAPVTGIVPGSRIAEPAAPTRDGYVFRGWYQESEYSSPWVFTEHTVNGNLTLYAKWEASPGAGTDAGAADTPNGGGKVESTAKTGDASAPLAVLILAAAAAAAVIFRAVSTLKKRNS